MEREMDTLPPGATFHPCPAPDLPPVGPPRPAAIPALHSRVTLPDGQRGRVVGTKTGISSPPCVQVRIDGRPAAGPHPWFLASQVVVEQVKQAGEAA